MKKLARKKKAEVEAAEGTINLITPNDDGLYVTSVVKGKEKKELNWEPCKLELNGNVLSESVLPRFSGWTYLDFLDELHKTGNVRYIEPMSAYEDKEYIDREENNPEEFAELKRDGHRALLYIGEDANRAFSRRVSKKTDWYNENTDRVPHVRDMILPEYNGTVIDGEFDYGKTSKEVQSVLGSLPNNAVQFQFKNGFVKYYAFDILYYKGINVQKMPLWKRKVYLAEVVDAFTNKYQADYVQLLGMMLTVAAKNKIVTLWESYMKDEDAFYRLMDAVEVVPHYRGEFFRVVKEGLEGLIVKNALHPYEQKRSKGYIKLKKNQTFDVFITGLQPPTRLYSGKAPNTWMYWEDETGKKLKFSGKREALEYSEHWDVRVVPVTKPHYMGWCGAIECGVWKKLTDEEYDLSMEDQAIDEGFWMYMKDGLYEKKTVAEVKGISESVQEDLKQNWEKYVEENRVLEVLAQEIIDKKKGSLRHPRFLQWRDDKSHEMCDFQSHIREEPT